MQIYKDVFNEIMNIEIDAPPEVGGIIGGNKNIVKKHFLESGLVSNKACSYTPNVSLLNAIIAEWETKGVYFMGIYHTHFNDVQTLSEGDVQYINRIMYSMPTTIERLYFPLVILPSRKMICYMALNKSDSIEICRDDLILI